MKPFSITTLGILAVRWLGLLIIAIGLWQLAANVLATAVEFDPSYIFYYFQSQMLRPVLGCLTGLLLLLLGNPLGKFIARGLEDNE